jgi:anti-sigma regulatory factor (Ser/Thr protein kinase)
MSHQALCYDSDSAYASGVGGFVQAGVQTGEAVMVVAPADRLEFLQAEVGGVEDVHMEEMTVVGQNPGRIIPAVLEFLQRWSGRPARVVQEAMWPDQPPQAMAEAARHEALINLAFEAYDVKLLCPYETAALLPDFVDVPWCTHPEVVTSAGPQRSERYESPLEFRAATRWSLLPPGPAADVVELQFTEVASVRRFVERTGRTAGLAPARLEDLMLAVNELATNSVMYGGGEGTVRLWTSAGAVIGEVADRGHITDPMVGQLPPGPALEARGLWLVNQLCDLVEIRSGPLGTQARVTFWQPDPEDLASTG